MICCRAKRVCNVKEEAAADGDMPELRGGCGPPGPLSLGASYGGLFRAVLGSDIGAKSAFSRRFGGASRQFEARAAEIFHRQHRRGALNS